MTVGFSLYAPACAKLSAAQVCRSGLPDAHWVAEQAYPVAGTRQFQDGAADQRNMRKLARTKRHVGLVAATSYQNTPQVLHCHVTNSLANKETRSITSAPENTRCFCAGHCCAGRCCCRCRAACCCALHWRRVVVCEREEVRHVARREEALLARVAQHFVGQVVLVDLVRQGEV